MPASKFSKPYKQAYRSGNSSYNPRKHKVLTADSLRPSESTSQDDKIEATRLAHSIDETMGFARYESGRKRIGWLCNMHSTSVEDETVPGGRAAVDFYFLGEEEGDTFKATVEYDPYFLVAVRRGREAEVEEWARRKFEGLVKKIDRVDKEDLKMPNHLLGYRRLFLKVGFSNVQDLLAVRRVIMPIAEKNRKNLNAMDTYAEVASATAGIDLFDDIQEQDMRRGGVLDATDFIVDIREYDVPYFVRVAIDKDIRIGKWYTVEAKHGVTTFKCIEERLQRADPVVMAYDIETTKLPLKFPDAAFDQVMMISYMIEGQGFLITNREIVSEDISDFDYTPRPEYDGPFMIFNEPDEKAVLERFFLHIKEAKPTVIATYNGDFFDWPFVETRAGILGIDMYREIGFRKNSEDIYQSNYCVHMDCFSWVNRDSYLPQGSRGLKAVTVAKLGYDPDELDPELMTKYAQERPQTLAEYSVSDAVATYYLYMKYVHPFIFSLCTIIPLNPDDTLRKGTGTLCEMLLMVQAYQKGIVLPNKHQAPKEAFWDGHLLESETYVGGHVESIEAGVFRSDIPTNFALDTTAIDELIRDLDAALHFSITVEEKKSIDDITNYDEVKAQIQAKLQILREVPNRKERPSIYHLDVASMYPNIMTTNRLQPDSMIQESDCAACDFNRPGKTCDRRLPWSWRGEFLPTKKDEYNMIKNALESERFPGRYPNSPTRTWEELSYEEQTTLTKKRLTELSKKIYHKIHETQTIEREAIICQRENPFYVDTVRNFRDRRYDFKGQQKVWKGKTESLKSAGAGPNEIDEASKMVILFDSLQLAHKVILNSFYGYVMRKGSRWYSMEMAGVTCLTGAHIIQMARQLVERIGRPLELDTDGIWCILPATFPENFAFKLKNGKKVAISYPCVMLNHLVHGKFTNHQYQTLKDPQNFKYETHSDNSIFFEVDGPYRAMLLPTSKEEDKNLKKRYAVFNHDGTLAELKGFEVKRRGELKLIKIFQQQIFKFFLEGTTLDETYAAVATVANRWLDVLHQKGSTLSDEELVGLISENRSMSKTLAEYGAQKSTSITTAKRLAEFLGEQMTKDKGLNCKYIISSRPKNAPVTERAIPVAIFSSDDKVKRFFLRKWMRDDPGDMDLRTILDWDYYLERLGSVVQKIITIPAALQKVKNPVPRVPHPGWLQRRINIKEDRMKQKKVTDVFEKRIVDKKTLSDITNLQDHRMPDLGDLEDFGSSALMKPKNGITAKMLPKRKAPEPAVVTTVDPYASLPAHIPDISKDYEGWLQYHKKKWKIQKQARVRRRHLFGDQSNAASDAIESLFRNKAELLFASTWQVLQLIDTEVPGEVRAFVLIDTKVHTLRINVPRQLFVNFKSNELPNSTIEGSTTESVNHTLPNGHPSTNLFRFTLPEEVYIRDSERITAMFNHSSVEGVYEKQITLSTRAVLDLGSLCTFDSKQQGVLGKGMDQGFDLSTLRRANSKEPYLSNPVMAYLFLYHIVSGDRQIFAFFSTLSPEAHVIMLEKSRDVQGLPNMDRIYTDMLSQRLASTSGEPWQYAFSYQDTINFKTRHVTTRKKAYADLSDLIRRAKSEESSKPLMMVVQSASRRMLIHSLPVLSEFPILPLRFDTSDSNLPRVGWQPFVAKRIVTHYLAVGSWITHLVELARYGDIPLCNLARDDPRYLIDIKYARRLQKANVVLWWSPGPRPDHAGHEKDDILDSMETVDMPSVNKSGTYSSVCVDIDVRNLAINTILTSSLINELEGSDSVSFNPSNPVDDGEGGAGTIVSEKAFASAGISVLREMVKAWWTEACLGSTMADIMVQHLVRWVEDPDSFLYDAALHYYVSMMSRKALLQLMTDFRRVGSHVVFASPSRLLIQTSKAEVGSAYAYAQYVLKSIKAKPLFHFLDLEVKEYWAYLAWYDEFNYGGKACSAVAEDQDEQPLNSVMHWQLATFLPPRLEPVFDEWVLKFIDLMHSLRPHGPGFASQHPSLLDSDSQASLPQIFIGPLKSTIRSLLTSYTRELNHAEFGPDWSTPPLLPCSTSLSVALANENPILTLIKSLTQVLSLSAPTNHSVRKLRASLLKLVDIADFSSAATFRNPSSSLKVPLGGVRCDSCVIGRDVDLCRDAAFLPTLVAEDTTLETARLGEVTVVQRNWLCESCGNSLDKRLVEERLVREVEIMKVKWATQDLKCKRCKGLSGEGFGEHCVCGGEWGGTVDGKTFKDRLEVLGRVAEAYEFRVLGLVVKEMTGAV
ncbi:MAG: DNA polymerase epsilon catalytic subunit [Vezdaea aestivalis]|nr:MAG: DNA polymerase epsilon catalytic subunit [Vezdaea aestivalis]